MSSATASINKPSAASAAPAAAATPAATASKAAAAAPAAATVAAAVAEEVLTMALDGETLTPEMLVHIGYGQPHSAFRDAGLDKHLQLLVPATKPPSEALLQPQNRRDPALTAPARVHVVLSGDAWHRVRTGRAVVDRVLARREVAYGINTGFGNFANVIIGDDKLRELQCNLIRSHASGVGQPLTLAQTRMLMALRVNVLAKGHSGVREETLHRVLAALNANCLPLVPCKGSVGASGDLAPLSHLALGMMGEGLMWDPTRGAYANAGDVLARHGLKPIDLQAKEGLALINGTQLITSIAAEAVVRAKRIARQADVVAALTLEALRGSVTPFHPAIHASRPHRGQGMVATRVRAILTPPSEIMNSHHNCGKVQDSYTLRCVPQIHGISHDAIAFCYGLIQTECNSATDNPMIFAALHRDTIPASPSFSAQPVPLFDGTVPALPASAKHHHHHHHHHGHGHSHGHAHPPHQQSHAGSSQDLSHYVSPAPNAHTPHTTPLPTRTLITGGATHQFSTDCAIPHTTTGLVGAAAATVLAHPPSAATAQVGSKRKAAASASASSASDSDSDASSIASHGAAGKSMFGVGKAAAGGALGLLSGLGGASMATPSPSSFSPASSASTPPHTPPLVPAIAAGLAQPSVEKKQKTDAATAKAAVAPAKAAGTASPMKVDAKLATDGGDPAAVKAGDLNDPRMGVILSGGNFHGEYPAKAADFLAIGVHELSSVSERRIERLVNPQLSSLPAFLTDNGGLNSGFMIAHCAAASLVSENKVLCHPSSVDSLSTSAAQEDHVSMGGFAARKALTVVEHVETVVAIELLAGAQALDYLRPLKSTPALEAVHKCVRSVVPKWTSDRFMSPDIEAVIELLQSERVWNAVAPHIDVQCHD